MVKLAQYALIAAAAVSGAAGVVSVSSDRAEARRYYNVCKPTIRGYATGQGLFGKGTAQARKDARWDWESRATTAYGDRYGNFDKARGVVWDCKKGAILQAMCVVTARPCLR
jgi:hypothetical protein